MNDDWRDVVVAPARAERRDPPPPVPPQPGVDVEFDDEHEARWRALQRQRSGRTVVESALLLIVPCWAAGYWTWGGLVLALMLVGPMLGVALHHLRAGRFGCGTLGALAYALVQVLTCRVHLHGYLEMSLATGGPFAFLVFAIYGVRREARSREGWENGPQPRE